MKQISIHYLIIIPEQCGKMIWWPEQWDFLLLLRQDSLCMMKWASDSKISCSCIIGKCIICLQHVIGTFKMPRWYSFGSQRVLKELVSHFENKKLSTKIVIWKNEVWICCVNGFVPAGTLTTKFRSNMYIYRKYTMTHCSMADIYKSLKV